MKNLNTEITINASSDKVWGILMDHKSYPNWNPFIKQLSGSTTEGEYLIAIIQPPDSKPMEFKPIVIKNIKGKEFRWLGKLFIKGVFDGEHYFILETIDAHKTRFIHGENFTGLFSGLLLSMIGDKTLRGFKAMNEAIKQQAETIDKEFKYI